MPKSQIAHQATYDFNAPATADTVLGFRVRANQGGKVRLKFQRAVSDQSENPGNMTFSVQVAPALNTGEPGTFIATTAAANLEAITNEVVGLGQDKSYEILLRANVDRFMLVKASGGVRAQLIMDSDMILDQWRTSQGKPALTEV